MRWHAMLAVVAAATLVGCSANRTKGPDGSGLSSPSKPLVTMEDVERSREEAQAAFDASEYAQAAQAAAAGLEGDPKDPVLLGIHGLSSVELGNLEDAAASLEAAAEAEPRDADIRMALAETYDELGDPEAAIPHAGMAAELLADDHLAHYAHGLLLMEAGSYSEAAEAFAVADALMPGDPELLLTMAEALMAAGDFETSAMNATAAKDAMVVTTPENESPHFPAEWIEGAARANELLAEAQLVQGDPSEESEKKDVGRRYLADIPELIEDPDLALAHQARAWHEAGYTASAVFATKQMTAVPDRAWVQALVARVYLDAGEGFDKALEAASRAVELEGESAENLSLRGWAEFKNKHFEKALSDLEAALGLARTTRTKAELHYRLYRTNEALGATASAEEHKATSEQLAYEP